MSSKFGDANRNPSVFERTNKRLKHPNRSGSLCYWGSEMVSANRVAAITPPYRRYGPDTEIQYRPRICHKDWQNSAEFSPKGKPIRSSLSIDPTSSIRTSIADAIFADAISETPSVLFPSKVVRSRMNSPNSQYNAPVKKSPVQTSRGCKP